MAIKSKTILKPATFLCRFFCTLGMLWGYFYNAQAQFGFVAGPYFVTPNFGSVCYGQEHDKIGNNQTMGGFVNLNFGKRLNVNISQVWFYGDRHGDSTNAKHRIGYGVGQQPMYDYLPLKISDIQVTYAFAQKEIYRDNDFWGGAPRLKTFGLRAGLLNSNRLVQVKPHQVPYRTYSMGVPSDNFDYNSWYDVTGLQQKMVTAGFEIDKYKVVEQFRNVFNRDAGKNRNRVYQQYFDVLFAYQSKYSNYGSDTFRYSGSSVKDVNPLGWRMGLRRITYNHLAHSFVCEFGQYPGQRRIPASSFDGVDVDRNIWKNWFIFVGFHLEIGHWFGEYE